MRNKVENHISASRITTKSFDCVDHKKTVENSERDGNTDHLTCLPRNLYADQEATVGTRHGTRCPLPTKDFIVKAMVFQ